MPAVSLGMIGSALISAGGAYSSNQASARAAERGYNTRYQRQVKDLQKAGLNPMLAVQQQPPVPNQPRFENVGEAAVEGAQAGSTIGQQIKTQDEYRRLMRAQGNAAIAQGDKANEEAIALRAQNVYSAQNAEAQSKLMEINVLNSEEQLKKIQQEVKTAKQLYDHQELLQPMQREYQAYLTMAQKLGLSEKEADAKYWQQLEEGGKYIPSILQTLKILLRQ